MNESRVYESEIKFDDGSVLKIQASPGAQGRGFNVRHQIYFENGTKSQTTVTCICSDGAGNQLGSTTKICPSDSGNVCDCSTPTSPAITCG